MVEFFTDYMQKDSVGSLSIAHLVFSDQSSIYSEQCMNIAQQCSVAVDFPKTGVPADRLNINSRPKIYPDYMQKNDKLMYKSDRLLGHLHRYTVD